MLAVPSQRLIFQIAPPYRPVFQIAPPFGMPIFYGRPGKAQSP